MKLCENCSTDELMLGVIFIEVSVLTHPFQGSSLWSSIKESFSTFAIVCFVFVSVINRGNCLREFRNGNRKGIEIYHVHALVYFSV